MHYQLAFDIAKSGYEGWSSTVFGFLGVVIGAFLVRYRRKLKFRGASVFAYTYLVFSVLWTITVSIGTAHDYSTLRDALSQGRAQLVEGRVEEFKPMPFNGHAKEHFSVCGVPFSYSDYEITGAFNRTSSHGGPIRAGRWVRIAYVGDRIARLEVATEDPGEQAKCHKGAI